MSVSVPRAIRHATLALLAWSLVMIAPPSAPAAPSADGGHLAIAVLDFDLRVRS